MNKIVALVILFAGCQQINKEQKKALDSLDEKSIRGVLDNQVTAWNSGDIEGFMQGYWKSDSLTFISSKIRHGWDSTLAGYKRGYPNKEAMGVLRFEILKLDYISDDACLVTGNYFLARENDNPKGIFTLLFRKKKGKWVVVYDHTS
jgi:hypothetical protein